MNKRQKKKDFKKRFGFNPPRGINIRIVTRIMERKEITIATFEWLKVALMDLWEWAKQMIAKLAEALKEACAAFYCITREAEWEGYSSRRFTNEIIVAAAGKRGGTD